MYFLLKRLADIIISLTAIVLLLPIFIIISISIILSSGIPVFYLQERIGKDWKKFKIIKFRTMINNAEKIGPGISSNNDKRITAIGKFLRKVKIDELPQLINVLKGDMSIIGPRPELLKYINRYENEYSKILKVKPGISDYASVKFRNEASILQTAEDSESFYLKDILPEKIKLYNKYIEEMNFFVDIKILFLTFKAILLWG
jgi:lipopolysaccharide/colanic/teichoic acid biosynthesis glycosyltransferase